MRHLTKRNDVYYFQRRIPTHLTDHYNGLVSIKFSLKTRSLRKATILARQHSANYDKEFYQIDLTLINKELESVKLPTSVKPLIKQQDNTPTMPLKRSVSDPKLSDCIDLYITTKEQDKISEKVLKKYKARLGFLLNMLKDKDINSYNRDDALYFKKIVVQMPPNIKNTAKYNGKSIEEIIQMGDQPISTHTINDTFKVVSGFFDWLVLNEKVVRNPFTKLKVKLDVKASEERKVFTRTDLKKIFDLPVFKERSKETWHYWMPLLGLYTGARINEICQLYKDDVIEVDVNGVDVTNTEGVDGIWCIDFKADREDQTLKTKSSWRTIPIHQKLIDLGFIEYVQSLPMGRIFSTLKYFPSEGYAKYPSKWFSVQRDKALTEEERIKKTFHSLRHTVANEYKQMGVEYSPASYLLGHLNETMTYGRYGKDYKVDKLKPIVDSLDFDIDVTRFLDIA
ncbi:DUF6538 domain-containing protein [Vibrio lentus]